MKDRSARTRELIQLGGLVAKAGLRDEPATDLLGAFVSLRRALEADNRDVGPMGIGQLRAGFRTLGKQAFDADAATHDSAARD